MELASTRKLLAVIISAIMAFSVSLTVTALVTGSTLASRDFFIKNAVTESIVSECEKQLSAKYKTLEAQSGIPAAVFETVKLEYPVANSLKTAFQNSYGNDNPELYNDALVKHFETLCTDYLDGNGINYKKEYVKNTAEEAAKIFSDTVGVHNMGAAADKTNALKKKASAAALIGLVIAVACALLLVILFSKKKRATVYVYGAICGGTAGTALGAALCRLISPLKAFDISPAVYKAAMINVLNRELLILTAFSLLIAAAAWVMTAVTIKRQNKKGR